MFKLWAAVVTLKGRKQTTKTDVTTYFYSIFQGDSLSVTLFVLIVKPLSFTKNAYRVMQLEKTVRVTSHVISLLTI